MTLCSDCPPENYPTDMTRCTACPRSTVARLNAAAATGNIEHYTKTIEAMIVADSSQGEINDD